MIRTGSKVKWKRGNSFVIGKVLETATGRMSKTVAGQGVTKVGASNNKVLYIEFENGYKTLLLEEEVERAGQ
jgi:hypothetical protein